jgi:hypothetical protein
VKSGTESFNCPDSENLCDAHHVKVGGVDVNEVILVTKKVGKKNAMARNAAKTTLFCDGCHDLVLWVCFWIVTDFTKYFYADFSGCDRRQTLLSDSASGWHSATR